MQLCRTKFLISFILSTKIVKYPFMDLNLATGIHNLINFVQFAFVQVPSITVMRCMWYGAKQPLLCTPQ